MGLLPEQASFEELVADAFTAFRGSGVMLSPLDAELVTDWSSRRIPFDVVVRGLQRAAEKHLWDARPGEPAVKSLRACRRDVEAEIARYLRASAGRGLEEDRASERVRPAAEGGGSDDRFRKGLRKLSKLRPELAEFCRRASSGAAFTSQLLRALPFSERLSLLKEAKALAAGQVILTANGRKLSRRFHRAAVLRRALDLPAFW